MNKLADADGFINELLPQFSNLLNKFRGFPVEKQTELLAVFDEQIASIESVEIKDWFIELKAIFQKKM